MQMMGLSTRAYNVLAKWFRQEPTTEQVLALLHPAHGSDDVLRDLPGVGPKIEREIRAAFGGTEPEPEPEPVAPEPIIVSYSELDTFRQCPLKHHLAYGMRWTKPSKEGSALQKGSLYHAVMEEHYRLVKTFQDGNRGLNPKEGSQQYADLIEACKAECRKLVWDATIGDWINDIAELIWWMYEGHIENYGLMDDWRIRAIEHQIITPLRDAEGVQSHWHLKAKLDLVIQLRSSSAWWVVDHKSGANLPNDMDLEIDDQFGLYTWAMREVGKPVQGSIHLGNRTQRNKSFMPLDTRMRMTFLNRDDIEIRNLALDAYYAARAAHPPEGVERARYSSPDPRSCSWKCDFKEPHLLMRRGRKPEEVLREYGFRIDRTRH